VFLSVTEGLSDPLECSQKQAVLVGDGATMENASMTTVLKQQMTVAETTKGTGKTYNDITVHAICCPQLFKCIGDQAIESSKTILVGFYGSDRVSTLTSIAKCFKGYTCLPPPDKNNPEPRTNMDDTKEKYTANPLLMITQSMSELVEDGNMSASLVRLIAKQGFKTLDDPSMANFKTYINKLVTGGELAEAKEAKQAAEQRIISLSDDYANKSSLGKALEAEKKAATLCEQIILQSEKISSLINDESRMDNNTFMQQLYNKIFIEKFHELYNGHLGDFKIDELYKNIKAGILKQAQISAEAKAASRVSVKKVSKVEKSAKPKVYGPDTAGKGGRKTRKRIKKRKTRKKSRKKGIRRKTKKRSTI
jgi:hypothetical protein